MALGKKINEFEALPEQILREFNRIFSNSTPLEGNAYAEVEIGEIIGPANVRRVAVDGKDIVYEFALTQVPLPGSFEELADWKSGDKIFINKSGANIKTIVTNAELENTIMDEKEMELEPVEYMLLQYLRGCQSPYHTQVEIAEKLNKSLRGLRSVLKQMEQKQMIKTASIVNAHRMIITVNEEWL